jgi:hypothetical protein
MNTKFRGWFITKGNLIHAYLESGTTGISQLINAASLTGEISGQNLSVTHFAYYTNPNHLINFDKL